jgi:hypothetical protein
MVPVVQGARHRQCRVGEQAGLCSGADSGARPSCSMRGPASCQVRSNACRVNGAGRQAYLTQMVHPVARHFATCGTARAINLSAASHVAQPACEALKVQETSLNIIKSGVLHHTAARRSHASSNQCLHSVIKHNSMHEHTHYRHTCLRPCVSIQSPTLLRTGRAPHRSLCSTLTPHPTLRSPPRLHCARCSPPPPPPAGPLSGQGPGHPLRRRPCHPRRTHPGASPLQGQSRGPAALRA